MKNRIHLSYLFLSWAIVVICSLLWDIHSIDNKNLMIARSTGMSFFKEIQATRLWNARHGGVYVPVTEQTQPNPYLNVPDRDVLTTTGINLTKINPAYMTRQIAEISETKNNIRYHITSLDPIRPENKADAWETEALGRFEAGEKDSLEFIKSSLKYRYMAPLITSEACLKCHVKQGYKIGDIRGGISVTIPAGPYLAAAETTKTNSILFHLLALSLGFGVLSFLNKITSKQAKKISEKNRELKRRIHECNETARVLEKSFLELSSAMDASDDVIYILDLDRRVLRANKSFYQMTEIAPDQATGRHIAEIIHPEGESVPCPICRAQENLEDASITMEADHPDNPAGQPIEVAVKIVRDMKDEPLSIYMCIHDLTQSRKELEEKNRLEEQLRQAHKMEAIGTMAGGIAHDFNNLLTPIIGYAEMGRREKAPEESPLPEYFKEILHAGYRAKDLVKNILTFSRKAEQEKKPLNIYPVVNEAIKLLRASIPTTIEIKHDLDQYCGNILGDPSQIHQILVNLCTNAAHAMEEKGGLLEITLHNTMLGENELKNELNMQPGEFIALSVTDNGEGIDPKIIDRIFEPYFTTKEKSKGSGMGLAIVHGIVKRHKGLIRLTSKINEGTCIRIFLPKIELTEYQREENEEETPLPRGNEKILVVDDDEIVANLHCRMLEHLGYEVTVETDSIEALESFRSAPNKFSLVVTDQTMPKMTGDQLTSELLAIRADIPIILCTGFSEKISAETAKAIGVRAFFLKPLEPYEMAHSIRKILDTAKAENNGG